MSRIDKVREKLQKENLDAILVSTPANIFYLTKFPFLVLTDREAFLFITRNAQYIISSPLYKEEFMQKNTEFEFLDISSVLQHTVADHLQDIQKKHNLRKIGFEGENLTYNEHLLITNALPDATVTHIEINDIREIKDDEEIAAIRKACEISDIVFEKTVKILKKGITEKEVALFMQHEISSLGAELAFPTIVAFGANAATPHHNTDDTPLRHNQFVLFDFGAKYRGYCSDLSRTVYFGNPTKEEIGYYNAVKVSQEKSFEYVKTSHPIIGGQIEQQARDYLQSLNLAPFMHSGHGMGVYDHELPNIRPASQEIITEGMVFTIEPGFYLPGRLGIRIEDDLLKTKDGFEILTHAPKELLIIN